MRWLFVWARPCVDAIVAMSRLDGQLDDPRERKMEMRPVTKPEVRAPRSEIGIIGAIYLRDSCQPKRQTRLTLSLAEMHSLQGG